MSPAVVMHRARKSASRRETPLRLAVSTAAAVFCLVTPPAVLPASAQSHEVVEYSWTSGKQVNSSEEPLAALRQAITVDGASCIRLFFNEWKLGPGSEVRIRSRQDALEQKLDAKSMDIWRSSAIFNGDAVDVEIVVAPGDHDVYLSIDRLMIGSEGRSSSPISKSLCGVDNRAASNDPAVGRRVGPGPIESACTAFLIANGGLVSAGHCFLCGGAPCSFVSTLLIEFNVPASDPNGTPVHAAPSDQYPVDVESVVGQFFGFGGSDAARDWVAFNCLPNSNTGLVPGQAQRSFVRCTRSAPSSGTTIRVTGFGLDDDTPTGHYAQQTATGPFVSENESGTWRWHEYQVDTTDGSSGAPVKWNANGFAIGIHVDVGCAATAGNIGNSFENDAVEGGLNNLRGPATQYLDNVSGLPETGTILEPWGQLVDATAAVPVGGTINFAPGTYTATIRIDKDMKLVSPVGTARVGQ